MTTTRTDWTLKLIEWGELRGWKPLAHRRALKGFLEFAGLSAQKQAFRGDKGFAADRALRLGYAALAQAAPDERAACRDWQSVKDLIDRQQAERVEAARREVAERGEWWVGHCLAREWGPRRLSEMPGVLTEMAITVRGRDEAEARTKLDRWFAIADELHELRADLEHLACFAADDPRYPDTCAAHAEVAARSRELERERHELTL